MAKLAFSRGEYEGRVARVRERMEKAGIDLLLVSDPANMNYLTGYDGWSFYVPQLVIVPPNGEDPLWVGRPMDAAGGKLTVWMAPERVLGYPEPLVQARDGHPMDWIAGFLRDRGWGSKRIGVESDSYYYSPKADRHLRAGLPNAKFLDGDLVVNWARAVKSEAEIAYLRQAARHVGHVMQTAYDAIRPGVRQCDAVAAIYAAQMGGDPSGAGDVTGLCPLVMAGEAASAAHPLWTDEPFGKDQVTTLELAAARRHYNAGLARTLCLGRPPQRLVETAKAVNEGLETVLGTIRPGMTGADVEAAWRAVLDRYGLKKESRIGYSIGIGYPPDWGEHTISLRPGDPSILEPNNTLHVMLGMWMDGWGMELSETVCVTETGVECLTSFPRDLRVKD